MFPVVHCMYELTSIGKDSSSTCSSMPNSSVTLRADINSGLPAYTGSSEDSDKRSNHVRLRILHKK